MRLKPRGLAGVTWVICCLCSLMQSQTQFDKAHSLLSQMARQRLEIKSDADRERLAKEISSSLPMIEAAIGAGLLDLVNTTHVSSPDQIRERLAATLRTGPETAGQNMDACVLSVGTQPNPSYVVAYVIPYCAACGRSWIGVLAYREREYHIVASLADPFPNQEIAAVSAGLGPDGAPRFLIYGTLWGDPHNRLNVAVFSFDGDKLLRVWSRSDLPQGRIQLQPGKIILSFWSGLRLPATERTEDYSVTPEGIQLIGSSERAVR
ncbi:MAG TPA: hypothetical protein VMU45_01845 [Candidatus Eisenbacteria bacterium]|nr:hypothetical protein [Candidatus Eisenbacteria bacterium]